MGPAESSSGTGDHGNALLQQSHPSSSFDINDYRSDII